MTSVTFSNIPNAARVPFFYAELDNSQANIFSDGNAALLIGLKAAAGTAVADVPVLVSSADQAAGLFGADAMLTAMVRAFRANNPYGELWCGPVAEPGAGTAAVRTVTFTGTAAGAGVAAMYVGAERLPVSIASGATAATVAAAYAAAINADTSLPVTASSSAGTLTVTGKFKGEAGNGVPLTFNRRGVAGGEAFPSGITAGAVTVATAGAGAPSLSALIANLGDQRFDFIGNAFSDATSLDALRDLMSSTVGRWSYGKRIYGHVYSARRGTLGAVLGFGVARNDEHTTNFALEAGLGANDYQYVAARVAREMALLSAHVARPTQTGELVGVLPPLAFERWTQTERQTLLTSGMATHFSGADGVVRIERSITSYQKNAWGSADSSYLDSETMHQLAYVLRRQEALVTSRFGRHGLRGDGRAVPAGIATPNMIRGALVADYVAMEAEGIVERADLFAAHLVVEISATNPNRVDVLYPPDLVNQLRIFALLAQFRLNY